jgi:hypothetical protein
MSGFGSFGRKMIFGWQQAQGLIASLIAAGVLWSWADNDDYLASWPDGDDELTEWSA